MSYSHSYYHRKTGMKVNSSDINTDVYTSDQNRASHLLKVTGASNNIFFSTRWQQVTVKHVFVIDSFIQVSVCVCVGVCVFVCARTSV